MLLSITILDQKEQPITLRELQDRCLLQTAFRGQRTLSERNLVAFIKAHPAYSIKVVAIGAPC